MGNLAAIFVAATVGGALAYRTFLIRRLGDA
jgi:hypothetical protein